MIFRLRDETQWHRVFAWLPHDVRDNRLAWLQVIERRQLPGFRFTPFGPAPLYEYRLIGEPDPT